MDVFLTLTSLYILTRRKIVASTSFSYLPCGYATLLRVVPQLPAVMKALRPRKHEHVLEFIYLRCNLYIFVSTI